MIFSKNSDGILKKVNFFNIDKERTLQTLVERNLLEVLDIRFLASEYTTNTGGRIDTLGIDSSGAPVIVEYKRNKNDNVITQSLSYLKWLKTQKFHFFQMLVIKTLNEDIATEAQWKYPRVICIAESYNRFDIDSLEFISANLELYRYQYYDNNIFLLENVKGENEKSKSSIPFEYKQSNKIEVKTVEIDLKTHIKTTGNDATIDVKTVEISLEMHLKNAQVRIRELFYILQDRICVFDEKIQVVIKKGYIAFKTSKIFAEVHVQLDNILIVLRMVEYSDFFNIVEEVPPTHGWGKKIRVRIKNEYELNNIMPLIERSYDSTK